MINDHFIVEFIETEEGLCIIRLNVFDLTVKDTYFLIDTGSSSSLICSDICNCENKKTTFGFRICNHNFIFKNKFDVIEHGIIPQIKDYKISGILGCDFFLKYNILIDFGSKHILNQSYFTHYYKKDINNIQVKLLPIPIKTPFITVRVAKDNYPCLIDSGSNMNIISEELYYPQDNKDNRCSGILINNLGGHIYGQTGNINIEIPDSFNGTYDNYISFETVCIYLDTNKFSHKLFKDGLIRILLGYSFLRDNGCILALSSKHIYLRHKE